MRTSYHLQLVISSISFILLSGCGGTNAIIPNSGPEILDVYESHISEVSVQPRMFRQLRNDRADLSAYTRTAANEIDLIFPTLANPEIVLYVYPHFSGKKRGIPGYSTAFKMYEKDEYALPGEIKP